MVDVNTIGIIHGTGGNARVIGRLDPDQLSFARRQMAVKVYV